MHIGPTEAHDHQCAVDDLETAGAWLDPDDRAWIRGLLGTLLILGIEIPIVYETREGLELSFDHGRLCVQFDDGAGCELRWGWAQDGREVYGSRYADHALSLPYVVSWLAAGEICGAEQATEITGRTDAWRKG
jgi:hypothetical protein